MLLLLLACSPAKLPLDASDTGDTAAVECAPDIVPGEGEVRTENGVFAGTPAGAGWAFLGIPFAAPPVGDLRFRAPAPATCSPGVVQATTFGAECPQWAVTAGGDLLGDEDCLTLNVWTPALGAGEGRPVLFFLHGGGNVQGSASVASSGFGLYDGAALAEAYGAVVVTAQYRLGALGFLAHPSLTAEAGGSGNYGLMDQVAALDWVHANIAGFGGDPDRVVLFGQSAGALDTCALYTAGLAPGRFAAAAMESGACLADPLADAEAAGTTAAESLGCSDAACLRSLSWQDLAGLSGDVITSAGLPGGGGYGPIVDGVLLTASPADAVAAGTASDVPLLVGSNADETSQWTPNLTDASYEALVRSFLPGTLGDEALALYDPDVYGSPELAWTALSTDATFGCPARTIARTVRAANTAPVYRYLFDNDPNGASGAAYGSWHGLELIFVFQHLDAVVDATGYRADDGDYAVQAAMGEAWTSLADGSLDGLSFDWPVYDDDQTLWLDAGTSVVTDPRSAECDFWDSLAG